MSKSKQIISNIFAFDPTVPIDAKGNALSAEFDEVIPRLLVENLRNNGATVERRFKLGNVSTFISWESGK